MTRVFFLINEGSAIVPKSQLVEHLPEVEVAFDHKLPSRPDEFDLIVLWSYRKIIPNLSRYKNAMLFHSSNLPDGKGWAPIYYSLVNGFEYYTISGILGADEVDSGDIVCRARFKLRSDHTAEYLRKWDHIVSLMMIRKVLDKFKGQEIVGLKQEAESTFNKRRRPEDNGVRLTDRIGDILPHLRACEDSHPAFFDYEGVRYKIFVKLMEEPRFPEDLEIVMCGEPVTQQMR